MKPTTFVLAFLILGATGVSAQEEQRSDLSPLHSAPDSTSSTALLRLGYGHSLGLVRFSNGFLAAFPSRSLQSVLIQVPGVAEVNGELHVRGSRKNQTGYLLNGFNVLDRYSNTPGITFIPEAMEEVAVHMGTYDASLGINGGGVVEMRMREGGDDFHLGAKYLTDDFKRPGEPFLDTYSYGWNTAVATLEGPLPFNTNFFVAGEFHRARDRDPMYLEPMYYEFVQGQFGSYPEGTPLPYPFDIKRNHVPSQTLDHKTVQWNISTVLFGIHANVLGSIGRGENPALEWYDIVPNYYRQKRFLREVRSNDFVGVKLSSDVAQDLSMKASIGFFSADEHTEDPDFGEDWLMYADSGANAALGYTDFLSQYSGPYQYSVIYDFSFSHQNYPNRSYRRSSRSSTQASLEAQYVIDGTLTLATSVRAEWWKVRRFRVNYIPTYYLTGMGGMGNMMDEHTLRQFDRAIDNIGYNSLGNETDDGFDRSRSPFFGALLGMAVYREGPVRLTLGVRQQFVGQDQLRLKGVEGDPDQFTYPHFERNLYPPKIDESEIEYSPIIGYTLPHGDVTYATEDLFLRLGAGLYMDTYNFGDLYRDRTSMESALDPLSRVPNNNSRSARLTYLARPERTSLLEVQASWKPFEGFQIASSMYRKHMRDQLMQAFFRDAPSNTDLAGLLNNGESTIYGIEATAEASTASGFTIGLSYAFSDAKGKAPDPSDWSEVSDEAWYSGSPYPDIMIPLAYAQKHRILLQVLFDGGKETVLEGLHAGVFGRYLSGHPFTQEWPLTNMGCVSVWRIGTRSLQDPRGRAPIEPYGGSEVPHSVTWDLHLSYMLDLSLGSVTLRMDVTNLFDTKNIFNLYPNSGAATTDGWFQSPYSQYYKDIPDFVRFYTDINYKNRWSYNYATGNDIYGPPRQIRFGVEVEI